MKIIILQCGLIVLVMMAWAMIVALIVLWLDK